MIFEVALGVTLGLLIYANLRGLLELGLVAVLFVLVLVLLGLTTWSLYEAFIATRNVLISLRLQGEGAEIFSWIFGVLANLLLAFSCGQVLQTRTSLRSREAAVFGVLFYALFIGTAVSVPVAVVTIQTGGIASAFFYLLALAGFWVFAIRQCFLRNRMSRQFAA